QVNEVQEANDDGELPVDRKVAGILDYMGDEDWFSLQATAGQTYVLNSSFSDNRYSYYSIVFDLAKKEEDGSLTYIASDTSDISDRLQWTAPADAQYV